MEKIKVDLPIIEDQKVLDEMRLAYQECKDAVNLLASLNVPESVIEENIAKIYDFVSDLKYCKHCPGVHKCQKNRPLLVTNITYNNSILERQILPCQEYMKQMKFENQFVCRDFPYDWLNHNLSSIDKSSPKLKALTKYLAFKKDGVVSWLYLMGGPRSGRSYFASLLTIDMAKNNKEVAFINSPQRIRELSDASYNDKEAFQRLVDLYSSVPVLVFDDFGNEYKSDYIRDAILFPIISNRANKRLFTIFTSDFTIKDIVTLFSTSKAGEIRAKQIGKILSSLVGQEINFGDLAIY